uniref:Uncharacterized protein n=1 Tax=Arundo donax TaxID=35708 RepID=A0A0A9EIQ3_ARUDO
MASENPGATSPPPAWTSSSSSSESLSHSIAGKP